ncbi:hypothetical protein E2493_06320 [Sphingomonas parva]|uniref:Uncharacterized protein n=1 Tax=Sphingomonas parva TaxID=2555898 RepID=A0A4Y8ZUJ7_9SPHN|nr:hypothetical protein [Sphingomonas parva]TFI59137.1 hypothetical protein E2493_06320 [Sphingomonas parva]
MFRSIAATCHLPEGEWIMDEDEETVLQPGGRAGAEAVAELARGLGFETEQIEADTEHNSWTFAARKDAAYIHTNVFHMDDEFYVSMDNLPGCIPLGGRRADYVAFTEDLFAAMARDARFSDVRWERR